MARPVPTALTKFAEVARPEIRRHHIVNSCVASAWITVEVMHRLGLEAEPCEVVGSFGNSAYVSLWKQFGPPKTRDQLDDWADRYGSYVAGVGREQLPGGIGGHVVAIVDGTFLVDASIDQVMNVQHDLVTPPVLVFEIDPRGLPLGILRYVSSELFAEYVKQPTKVDYTKLPDWGRTADVLATVERIVATIQPSL